MSDLVADDSQAKGQSDENSNEERDFSFFNLDERILAGLTKAGYKIPTPIQLEAVPLCLTGSDVFVQGKPGTGKTLVFSILALSKVTEDENLQVLIVAPTREIVVQTHKTINTIGSEFGDLKCECFIGGFNYKDDVLKAFDCKIAVGTPGRIGHLISEGKLQTATVRLFVLDDADKLLNKFMKPEMDDIFRFLPEYLMQTVVTSITDADEVVNLAEEYLKSPYIACHCEEGPSSLSEMAHYYYTVQLDFLPALIYRKKLKVLKEILSKVKFTQCIIFGRSIMRVENLYLDIKDWGFSIATLTKAMDQVERLNSLELLKNNKCKVFVSTDVSSRGIDAENVDLIINFELPCSSYMFSHRCGRAGRNGAKSSSITFLLRDQEDTFAEIVNAENFKCDALPEPIPEILNCNTVADPQCKPPSSTCNFTENTVPSLTELCKNEVINLEKTKPKEYAVFTASKTEKQDVNLDFVNANLVCSNDCQETTETSTLPTCEESVELPSTTLLSTENVLSSSELKISSNLNEEVESQLIDCSPNSVSSDDEARAFNGKRRNLAISSSVEELLTATHSRNEYRSAEKLDVFSTGAVPKRSKKVKSTSKPSQESDFELKTVYKKRLGRKQGCYESGMEVPHKIPLNSGNVFNVKSSKSVGHCKSKGKLCERQVAFCGLSNASESDTDQCYAKFCPRSNCIKKKTTKQDHQVQSNDQRLEGYNHSHPNNDQRLEGYNYSHPHSNNDQRLEGYNHSHPHSNVQRSSFSNNSYSGGHCGCCNSRPCCPRGHCYSLPKDNWQQSIQMQQAIFYNQWKFINDFSYFLSHFLKG